jgi:hypothetical protein
MAWGGLIVLMLALAGAAMANQCDLNQRQCVLAGSKWYCQGGGVDGTPTAVPTATSTPAPLQSCFAENDEHRCYAFARAGDLSIDGAQATFDTEQYTAPDWASGGHSRQVVWMGDESGNWCEVGEKQGGYGPLGQLTNSFNVYSAYMSSGIYIESVMSYSPGAFGTVHTYKIAREAGTGIAQTSMDSVAIAECRIPTPSSHMDVGLEYTDENAVNQGVSPYNLQVRDYLNYNSVSDTWSTWASEAGVRGLCIFGSGAYLAWIEQDRQITDSSNILPGNENNACL